ncbi:ABC transporter substrate-binding protein [Mesorhizobium sp.]|uniref:ABC transporter substrate-binding protein n=1 Tax=Mesorhizobium sp. TaxID=1871066 RepID=UPI000FE50115|nr:ABC transporter substrate-binding protein [Mesorhizobium sp.]RWP56309.1 MAG: ABC transporter substrate-binding protein [Mesorhizobium sp.]
MSFRLNRRRFMQSTSSALAFGALSSVAGRASAQSPGEVRVMVGGGDWGKANIEAYVKPFEAETGIKVQTITDDILLAQMELMAQTKNVTVDIVVIGIGDIGAAVRKDLVEQIDYSIYNKGELDGISDAFKHPYAVASSVYSFNMVYNTKTYPPSKPRPTSWSEFWDAEKFPGLRVMRSGESGEGPWEEALLADGVPADKLYPLDIDRVFASLDKIKPHVRKWWATGSEIQQILHDGAADLAHSFDGRAQLLIDQGAPVEINRNQAKLTFDYWVISKGSPNAKNAQKFLEFATRANNQANFSKLFSLGPSNLNAFKLIPDNIARKLASHPDYKANSIPRNAQWYSEIGADGLTNQQRFAERWKEWSL